MPELLDLHSETTKVIRAAADAAMRRHGLRLGQDHLLAALWEKDGRTPGEIAAATNVTTPAVTKVVPSGSSKSVFETEGCFSRAESAWR